MSPLAVSTSSITAVLRQVPNQPIRFWVGGLMNEFLYRFFFKSDETGRNRTEDEIIAWTWKKYLDMNGSDPTVLLQLPMTKVR
jgi:PhoPQ-activated pathogenicity-related protein